MEMFSIGEIARRAGIATSTIRYYERIGLLPPSRRVNTKRRYDLNILQKLGVIRLAQRGGLTLAEIQTLLHEFPADTPPSERWQVLAGSKIVELDRLIEKMQIMRSLLTQTLQCQCPTLDDCASETVRNSKTGEVCQ
ncbi:MAG TPA: MerR family transcriptional regulator [Phototrophicaceae bacterium]|nr:MerR family transcriptional regulator [Phototrophicaceae bacterium]